MAYSKTINNDFIFFFRIPSNSSDRFGANVANNLLPIPLSHRSCHNDRINGWIFINTYVQGSSKFAGCALISSDIVCIFRISFSMLYDHLHPSLFQVWCIPIQMSGPNHHRRIKPSLPKTNWDLRSYFVGLARPDLGHRRAQVMTLWTS